MEPSEPSDLKYCREGLNAEGISIGKVSKATGLSRRWLEYIRGGRIPNPGIQSIQTLKTYLQQHDLGAADGTACSVNSRQPCSQMIR